jgi:hypothetical protein
MAQAVAFQAVLQRLGCPPTAIQAINANGITTTQDLIGINDKDVENILKIIRTSQPPVLVPYIAQKRINTLCYWVNRRTRLNEPIDAVLFTQQMLEQYSKLIAHSDLDEESTVKPPADFKAGSKWKPFKEGAIAYFNSIRGSHQIPLTYVIRDNPLPNPNQVYNSEHERLIDITPLQGIEYEDDNGRVFDFLKSWTLSGPAWTWMRAFNNTRDGRNAWLALTAHFKGDAQRDRVKDNAYASIANAKYHGERKRFSFETYVTIHQEAYSDLVQYGEQVSEEKRVRDLLQGIKDNSPAANAAKGTILATPNLRNNFSNAVTHLATTLQLSLSLQETRNISTTQTGGPGRNGRGRGRDGGRGRGHGRGRGRGRGGGRNIYLGSYSPEQWRKLSAEDKKRVYDGREQSAQQRLQTQIGGTNRNLSAVSQDDGQSIGQSIITIPTTIAAPTTQTVDTSNAGDKRQNPESAGSVMSRRRINAILSTARKTMTHPQGQRNVANISTMHHDGVYGQCELDSHADTCVAGQNCIVVEYTDQVTNVSAFSPDFDILQDVPIVTAATAYDDPHSGITTILILGQALWMPDKVTHTLICPNQLRQNGITVDDVPVHLAPWNRPSTHSIICPDDDNFTIPLSLQGPISYFPTRAPTQEELDTCLRINLTDESLWDPHSDTFQHNESNALQSLKENDHLKDRSICSTKRHPSTRNHTAMADISNTFDDKHFLTLPHTIASTTTATRNPHVDPEALAQRWGIGLQAARNTLKVTTQKGVRSTTHPIERRFRTRQAQLRYRQLSGRHGRFYTDTFFASYKSLHGCKTGQLYINDLQFSKFYPMKNKGDVSDTLAAFIHDVGIPHIIHSDDAQELMHGKFRSLCKEYGIPSTFTEPHSPWQNRAEAGIRELKRHVHRKMKARCVPFRLWDYCCKWSCDIRNKTASDLFMLEGRTPFEAVLGDTPDISSIAMFDFYEPIWYFEQHASFPEPKRLLGRWLGEATNVGQAMCYWVLPESGIPIARSTVQQISDEQKRTKEV